MENFLKSHRENVRIIHNNCGCEYGGNEYVYHLDMVVNGLIVYEKIFKDPNDYKNSTISGFYHDTIEDAQLTFNNIKSATNIDVARIVLAVTDVHEENRLLRHLATMGKTVKDYRAIIVKMCDIRANAMYSRESGSSMYM